jgi:hypothetical protein
MQFTRQSDFLFDSLKGIGGRENAQPAGMLQKVIHDRQSALKVWRFAEWARCFPSIPVSTVIYHDLAPRWLMDSADDPMILHPTGMHRPQMHQTEQDAV